MRNLSDSIFCKMLWRLMFLYFINISVDLQDQYPNNIKENLSYNDQESFVELFSEKLLGFEDAFVEYDDHDNEESSNKKNSKLTWVIKTIDFFQFSTINQLLKSDLLIDHQGIYCSNDLETISPPPEV